VILGLGLGAIVSGVSMVLEAQQVDLLNRIDQGTDVDLEALFNTDDRLSHTDLAQIVLFVATAVVFVVWFHRAYANLARLGAASLRFGPGWAIGGWFVPILSFWRPKQIANDIWRASDPDAPATVGTAWREEPVAALLHWWWAAWLVSVLLGRAASSADSDASTVVDQVNAAYTLIVSDGCDVVTALLAAVVVWRLSRRQDERARRLRAAESLRGPGGRRPGDDRAG
jgi:hypothetical protein